MQGTKKLLYVIGGKSVILTMANAPSNSPELEAVIQMNFFKENIFTLMKAVYMKTLYENC